jgi:hypothetical protein
MWRASFNDARIVINIASHRKNRKGGVASSWGMTRSSPKQAGTARGLSATAPGTEP